MSQAEPSRANGAFEALLRLVVAGSVGPGARMPSERDLAEQLGVARVTVREAVRRLVDARVLSTRQGSGAVVRPRREWSLRALPLHLESVARSGDPAGAAELLEDALQMRRAITLDLIERAAARLRHGSLEPARQLVRAAWQQRDDAAAFFALDWQVVPMIVEQAGMLASLWLLNGLEETYLSGMAVLAGPFVVAPDYLEVHLELLDRLEAGDAVGARRQFEAFFDRLDARRIQAAGGATTSSPPDRQRPELVPTPSDDED